MKLKTTLEKEVYTKVIKPILFKKDPEEVHSRFIKLGKFLGNHKTAKAAISYLFNYSNEKLNQDLLGIQFKNPVGLSAGFDKNAEIISILEDVGFGFAEVGSISAKPCAGNQGKRLDRIPEKQSLWVYYGLMNNGADIITQKLKQNSYRIPYGISIAPTNCKENLDVTKAIQDYTTTLEKSKNLPDYITINISCPNAESSQPFLIPENLENLLKRIVALKIKKPIFLKLSPDKDKEIINKILKLAHKYKIQGIICTNLTKKHDRKKGGLSGKYLEKLSNALLKHVYQEKLKHNYDFILIGVGGIFSGQDAYHKIKLGANLVQLITGMIYNGPSLISEINQDLVKLLEKEGYNNISEAVGKEIIY